MKNRIRLIGGLLIGVALGTAGGILMAPSSGKRTRNLLMKKSRKMGKEFSNAVRYSIDGIKNSYNRKVDQYGLDGMNSIKSLKEKMKV